MPSTRREPYRERVAALARLRGAVLYGALAAIVWFGAQIVWPDDALDPDEPSRDQIVGIASAYLAAVATLCLAAFLFHAARWMRARRFERMLDDPEQAHRVPPLRAHVDAVPAARGGCALLAIAILLGLGAVGLVTYGVLALGDHVARIESEGEDQSWPMIVFGAVLMVAAVAAARRVRKWHVARRVERLSNDKGLMTRPGTGAVDPNPTGPVGLGPLAGEIPELDVRFVPVGPHPLGDRQAPLGTKGALPRDILYLRLFDNVGGTERFVNSAWRQIGYVHILRSASQVEADELEAAEDAGTVASLFIRTPAELDEALRRQPTGRISVPRPEGFIARWRWASDAERGRYPVRALLCHGSFWHTAVDLLLERMDLVVIDLTGYRTEHAGTRFELQRVIDRFPIEQVTLLAERGSDQRFLAAQVRSMWRQMGDGSPNAGSGSRQVRAVVG